MECSMLENSYAAVWVQEWIQSQRAREYLRMFSMILALSWRFFVHYVHIFFLKWLGWATLLRCHGLSDGCYTLYVVHSGNGSCCGKSNEVANIFFFCQRR